MKKTIILSCVSVVFVIFLLLFSSFPAFSQEISQFIGEWKGGVDVPNQLLEIVVKFNVNSDNTITGTIDIPAQGQEGLKLGEIKIDGNKISFIIDDSIVQGDPSFNGELNKETNTITGHYYQYEYDLLFQLKKEETNDNGLKFFQLQVYVTDIEKAVEFYGSNFGFTEISRNYLPQTMPMQFGDTRVVFHKVDKKADVNYPADAQTFMVFKVSNLKSFMKKLKDNKTELLHNEPQKAAPGMYAAFRDPFGNVHEILEVTSDSPDNSAPSLYGTQINVTDMDKAIDFYSGTIGLEIVTKDYYPQVVPMILDNKLIVLHKSENVVRLDYPNIALTNICFQVRDIAASMKTLTDNKYEVLYNPSREFALGLFTPVKDPSGNIQLLIEVKN